MEEGTHYEQPRLTSLSTGSGCGCKIAPVELEKILKEIAPNSNDRLLIDQRRSDDAAVIRMDGDQALIMTNDFFTPIVDDPFEFGRIAATNAISDIYAMGGKPFAALSILGWPVEQLGTDTANAVLQGANQVCNNLGVALAGGHSIESKEPFFGLAVNGSVHVDDLVTNQGVQEGDLLYLSKPLGTGMMSSALKREQLEDGDIGRLIDVVTEANTLGEGLGKTGYVHAMTDVTGFGLLGHSLEMCGTQIGIDFTFDALPLIDDALLKKLSAGFVVPNNTMRNFKAYHEHCTSMNAFQLHVLCDPQTSGGLLIAIDQNKKEAFEALLNTRGVNAACIGQARSRPNGEKLIQLL